MEPKHLTKLLNELTALRSKIVVPDENGELSESIINLREYLNLRKHDLSALQDELTKAGLSSLGRSQSHIGSTLDALINILSMALGQKHELPVSRIGYEKAHGILKKNSEIFSKSTKKTKIMMTVPSSFREDTEWFKDLSDEGVSLFRINTAHDTPDDWREMARMIDSERTRNHKDIKIYVDLSGPKIRTTDINTAEAAETIGSKKHNREFYLIPKWNIDLARSYTKPALYVDTDFLRNINGSSSFEISDRDGVMHTVYFFKKNRHGHKFYSDVKFIVTPHSILRHVQNGVVSETPLLFLSEENNGSRVFFGNKVVISPSNVSIPAAKKMKGNYDARIGCTLENVADRVKPGDKVFIDDGKVELQIDTIHEGSLVCTVLTRKPSGVVIKPEKGINFPGTAIAVCALDEHDKKILPDIAEYADIIGISFTQSVDDVHAVTAALEALGKNGKIGIVAKIETQKGVENLPQILEALIGYGKSGVMIARGDLAIEIGYENLAFMQEEILDLCAAAHMPVILATQVLENKMKTNIPSRAEITDAAFAHKAECVMLNKGEYARETIKILNAIFTQMDLVFRKNKLLLNPTFQWK